MDEKSFHRWEEVTLSVIEESDSGLTPKALRLGKPDWYSLFIDSLKIEAVKCGASVGQLCFYLKYIENFSCEEIGYLLKISKYFVYASVLETLVDECSLSACGSCGNLRFMEEILLREPIDRDLSLDFERHISSCDKCRECFNFYLRRISVFRARVKDSDIHLSEILKARQTKRLGFFSRVSLFS